MKAIAIMIIIGVWVFFTWILAKAAGMASREEERWENEQDHTNDT